MHRYTHTTIIVPFAATFQILPATSIRAHQFPRAFTFICPPPALGYSPPSAKPYRRWLATAEQPSQNAHPHPHPPAPAPAVPHQWPASASQPTRSTRPMYEVLPCRSAFPYRQSMIHRGTARQHTDRLETIHIIPRNAQPRCIFGRGKKAETIPVSAWSLRLFGVMAAQFFSPGACRWASGPFTFRRYANASIYASFNMQNHARKHEMRDEASIRQSK